MGTRTILTASLDEILFEGKNKSYGAFQLRSNYSRYLGRAALIAMLLFLTGTTVPKMVSWFLPPADFFTEEILVGTETTINPPPVIIDEEEENPIDIPETKPLEPEATVAFVVPVPDENAREEESIHEISQLGELQIGTEDREGSEEVDWENLEISAIQDPNPIEEKEIQPFDFVELDFEPHPINMKQFIDAVGYPPNAVSSRLEGKVLVKVQVDKQGQYLKHIVLKNPHPVLTKAVEAKLSMLRFSPGIQAGRPVKVWIEIPVDFQLN